MDVCFLGYLITELHRGPGWMLQQGPLCRQTLHLWSTSGGRDHYYLLACLLFRDPRDCFLKPLFTQANRYTLAETVGFLLSENNSFITHRKMS